MEGTYEYDPLKLKEKGKDLMRFELGDTETEDGALTSALCDEEYEAILAMYPDSWDRAKLHCIESIFRRFSYEPDTVDGSVQLKFGDRAKLWQDEYRRLKEELAAADLDPLAISANLCDIHRDPYFTLGMMSRDHVGEAKEVRDHAR